MSLCYDASFYALIMRASQYSRNVQHKICEKITRYFDSYRIERSHTKYYQKKLKDFKTNAQVLFDIAACRCTSASVCKCKPELKVPPVKTYSIFCWIKGQAGKW